jgi:TonB family protein
MIFTLALLFASFQAQASAPIQDEPISVPKIEYPAEAKAARITGTVQLQINVDATGHVTEVHALSGPIALRQAAIDAYAKATYRPILIKGRPAPANITSSVNFTLHELPPDTDLLVDRQFQPLQARCQQLSTSRDANALPTCRQALDEASHFVTPTYDLEAHATAFNDIVLLLIADGKKSAELPEAGVLADQAVELVNLTVKDNPHTPAVAVAYITRCEVRSLAGSLKGAGQDCAVAEETLTTLLHDYPENDRAANYRVQLRETLQLHAIVAERDHHASQAEHLRNRAASL